MTGPTLVLPPQQTAPTGGVMRARLVARRNLTADVAQFLFEIPGPGTLHYQPGQHIGVVDRTGNNPAVRWYSIASPPDGRCFELCVRHVPEGAVSSRLFALKPGEAIEVTSPRGRLVLQQPLRRAIFVATGTAVAPFRAMLLAPETWLGDPEVRLLLGARSEEELLYDEDWKRLAASRPKFDYWPVLSRPAACWSGRRGYVQSHLKEAVGENPEVDVYLCGWEAMVQEAQRLLVGLGVSPERIFTE